MTTPRLAEPIPPPRGVARDAGVRVFGEREQPLYADQFEIYFGNANPELARKICSYLGTQPGRAEVFQFANENIFVKILENVREKDVFLVQPTSHPVNQSIMELLIMIDAFKRASAGPDHRGDPVLRLRPLGQEGPAARPDHGPAHRRHDHRGRRGPGPDDGPPPGPDPGLLQHPGRRADRRPHALELLPLQEDRGPGRRHRPRLRQARPHVRGAARRPAGDHREAARRQPRPGRADERHRRRPRQARDHRRRRDRHRPGRSSRSSARSSARASPRSTPAPPTAC